MPIIGHQRIIQFFDNAILNGKLAQAYCLVGPDQIGKRTLARYLAIKLLNINEKQLNTHPDFYYLNREENEKTGKLKKDISISQARLLKERVSNKSWLGGYRVIIIDEAELLNKESANALLKVLEDVKEKILFFLLTVDDNALLPTIKSRCQLFYLLPTPTKEITDGLEKAGFDKIKIEEVLPLAWGCPGKAIELLADETARQIYLQEEKRWEGIIKEPFYQRIKKTADLLGVKDEAATAEKLSKIFSIWLMLWRRVLLDKIIGQDEKSSQLSKKSSFLTSDLLKFLDLLKNARIMLRQNINPKLLIEELMLNVQ